MTVKEAAARLRLSPDSIYAMVRNGILPARRLGPKGGKIVLDPADVEAHWDASRVAPPSPPRPIPRPAPGPAVVTGPLKFIKLPGA